MTTAPLPTQVDLSQAPGADMNLDDLFPAEPVSVMATTVASQPAQPTAPATTTPPVTTVQPDETFLKGERSVYRTRDAAVQGLNEKDALIEQLRQQYSLATGIDPISKRPLSSAPQAAESYVTNSKKYVADLRAAQTDEQLAKVQAKFVMDTLQPVAPAIANATKNSAIQQARTTVPEFDTFYGSKDYKDTLEQTPSLRDAIEAAESDIQFHSRLPDLYRTAYLVSRGIKLPELIKQQSTAAGQPNTPVRTVPVTTAPAPETTTVASPETIFDAGLNAKDRSDARKAYIRQFEDRWKGRVIPDR